MLRADTGADIFLSHPPQELISPRRKNRVYLKKKKGKIKKLDIFLHIIPQSNQNRTENTLSGRIAQSVTCLATDACLTADPGVASLIPVWSHTFVEIDHEITSTVILLPSADLFKKGCCQLQAKVCARITG